MKILLILGAWVALSIPASLILGRILGYDPTSTKNEAP